MRNSYEGEIWLITSEWPVILQIQLETIYFDLFRLSIRVILIIVFYPMKQNKTLLCEKQKQHTRTCDGNDII